MADQKDAWEAFYTSNNRPWRGISSLQEIPFKEGDRILEIGCGNGKTAAALIDKGMAVTGLDFSQSAVDMCIRTIPGGRFVCGTVTDMPFTDSEFSGAVIFHVLEHLTPDELALAVGEICRVLCAGSHVIVKCFARGDMRSDKGTRIDESTVVRGNGIMYHYFSEDELCQAFSGFDCDSIHTVTETTRFGEIRSRIEADFRVMF